MSPLKTILATTFFGGYLAVQLLLPGLSWLSLSSGRWGWGMYSGRGGATTLSYEIHFPDRPAKTATEEGGFPIITIVSDGQRVASIVSTLDRRRFVLPHLCQVYADAEWVGIRYGGQQIASKAACQP